MQNKLINSISSARSILESLRQKIYPLTLPHSPRSNSDENQPLIANKALKAPKAASDLMELQWLKSTIDKLCNDNAVLYRDITEILRVVEFLGLKCKEMREGKDDWKCAETAEVQVLRQKLELEKHSNARLRSLIAEMKLKYERLIEALKTYAQEEMEERVEEEMLIERLTTENETLRRLLLLNCSEKEMENFEKEISEKEKQYRFLQSLEERKSSLKESYFNEESHWEQEYKELNEFSKAAVNNRQSEPKTKEPKTEEIHYEFDEFENFEQFLMNFKQKQFIEDPPKQGFHRKSKTNSMEGSLMKNKGFQRNLKKLSFDDSFI